MRIRPILLLLIVLSIMFSSCQDDPTSVGEDLIENPVELKVIDSSIDQLNQSSASYQVDSLISFGGATRVLLGKKDDISSKMLLRFGLFLPDTIRTSLEDGSLQVNSAIITLYNNYTFGNKNANFDFSAYNITSSWSSLNFNSDSLSMLSYDPADVTTNKTFTDSSITFDLENSLALSWLTSIVDTNEVKNYGLLFEPSAATDKILGFRAYTGSSFSDSPVLAMIVESPGNFVDTLIANPLFDVHVVEGETAENLPGKILLQAGIGGRGDLFFDLSKIPANSNVNSAELTLTVDTLNTVWGTDKADSIQVRLYSDSTQHFTNSGIPLARLGRFDNTFNGDIANIIQEIVLGKDNYGFDLRLSNEDTGLDIVYLDGTSSTNLNARPRLVIYYSRVDL